MGYFQLTTFMPKPGDEKTLVTQYHRFDFLGDPQEMQRLHREITEEATIDDVSAIEELEARYGTLDYCAEGFLGKEVLVGYESSEVAPDQVMNLMNDFQSFYRDFAKTPVGEIYAAGTTEESA
jgi:hypothetical protein